MGKKDLNDLCMACGRGCESDCEAALELRRIYAETRLKEKRKLIHRLKAIMDIADAEPSPDMESLANSIIAKIPELRFIKELSIKVGYVSSYERKTKAGRVTYGDCRKVNPTYSAYLPFDFVITFYEPNIGHLSDNQIKLLMWHELKHIDVGVRGLTVRPHDIEDFYSIIDSHGTRWDELGVDVGNILE